MNFKLLKFIEAHKHHAACEFSPYILMSGGLAKDTTAPFKNIHACSQVPSAEASFERVVQNPQRGRLDRSQQPYHDASLPHENQELLHERHLLTSCLFAILSDEMIEAEYDNKYCAQSVHWGYPMHLQLSTLITLNLSLLSMILQEYQKLGGKSSLLLVISRSVICPSRIFFNWRRSRVVCSIATARPHRYILGTKVKQ